jgi:hypothetical protein
MKVEELKEIYVSWAGILLLASVFVTAFVLATS